MLHQNLNLNQVMQEGMSEVCVCMSFWPHMQSRGGSYSELSCLRSEDILSVTIYHHWTDILVSFSLICFLQAELPGVICKSSVITLKTSVFIVVLDALLCLLHLSTLFVNPLMGCKGLFCLVMSVIIDTTVRLFTVGNIWV